MGPPEDGEMDMSRPHSADHDLIMPLGPLGPSVALEIALTLRRAPPTKRPGRDPRHLARRPVRPLPFSRPRPAEPFPCIP